MIESNTYTALVLAAGIGSRISDLTNEPKCLLRVNGKTILEWQLEALLFCGVKKVFIITGYKDSLIQNVALQFKNRLEINFIFNNFFDSMGNAYSLYLGLKYIKTSILIFDADLIYDKEILYDFINTDARNLVLVGNCTPDDVECTKVLTDSEAIVRQFADKRKISNDELSKFRLEGEAIGILKFSKCYASDLFQACNDFLWNAENRKSNWEGVLNLFIANHDLNIHRTINEKWIEVDTKQDFEKATSLFVSDIS